LSGEDVDNLATGRYASAVELRVSKNGGVSTPVSLSTNDGLDDGSWSFTQDVDTAGHTDDGLYVYTLIVTDMASKVSTASRTVRIDTTAPNLAITAPASGEPLLSNITTFTGTASDVRNGSDPGTGVDPATLKYILNGGAPVALTLVGSSWTVTNANVGATEGAKTLAITGKDKVGNTFTTSVVTFYYDIAPPTVEETTVATTDTQYTNGSTFSLGGTLYDSNAVGAVTITGTKGVTAIDTVTVTNTPGNTQNATWSSTVNLTTGGGTIGDGIYIISITGKDVANKSQVVQRTIRVDTVAPTITPAAFSGWKSGSINLSGTAIDNGGGSGLQSVQYKLVNNDSVTTPIDWTSANGTTAWSVSIDTASLSLPESTSATGYTVYLRSVDKAGNPSTESTLSFGLDSAAPKATIDVPGSWLNLGTVGSPTYVTNASFSLTGSDIDDTNTALRYVQSIDLSYVKDSDTPVSATVVDNGLLDGTWSYTQSVTGLNDGLYVYTLTVTDKAGKVSTSTKTVLVDTKVPSLLINSVSPTAQVGANTFVNGNVTISVSTSDDNGLTGVKYFVLNTATPPTYDDAGGVIFGTAPYSKVFDTTTKTDGTWYLHVLSKDRPGNVAIATATLKIDQTTDLPTGGIDSPGAGIQIGADKKVRGTFSDDDGVSAGAAKLRVKKSTDGTYTEYAIANAATAGQLISWNVDVTSVLTAGGDGTYDVYLYVEDINITPKVLSLTPQTFNYDNEKPTVSTVGVSPAKAAYKTGDVLTLSWIATDASGISSQLVDLDGGASGLTAVTNPSGTNFQTTYTVPAKSLIVPLFESGSKTFTLVTEDGTGKTTSKTVTFLVDVDKPAVENALTLTPAFIGFTPNGTFSLKGTASDNRGLSKVEVSLKGPTQDDWVTPVWQVATLDAGNWTLAVNSATYVATSGTLSIKVRSTDQAGNVSDETSFTQAVDQAADKPTVAVISPVNNSTYGTTVQISGTGADDDNLSDSNDDGILDTDSIQIEYWDIATPGTKIAVTPTITGSGKSGTFNYSLTGLAGATYAVHVRSKDDAGTLGDWSTAVQFSVNAGAPNLSLTTVDTVSATSLNSYRKNKTIKLEGTATDSDRIHQVRIRVNGGAWNDAVLDLGTLDVSTTVNWRFDLDLGSDGLKTLEIQASDTNDFVANQQLSTTVDTKVPTGTFDVQFKDNPTGSLLELDKLNKVVRITGTVTELNLVDTTPIELFIDGSPVNAANINGTFVWNYVWDTSALLDGTHTLALRITDKAGNVTNTTPQEVSTLQSADTPTVTSSLVAAASSAQAGNNVLGALLKVSGTFSDDDGFDSSTIKLLLDADPTELAGTNTAGTTGTWEYTWASLTSGEHYVRIKITDRNGATVTTSPIYFLVDTQNPTLTLTTPSAGAKARAGALTVSGSASDAGGLGTGPLSITLQHSNVLSPLHNTIYTPTVSAADGTWTLAVAIDGASLDGTLYLNLILTDRAGKTSSVTRTVTLDTTAPSLTLSYPSTTSYINGLVTVTGTADDANGLSTVTMEILDPTTKLPKTPELTRSGSTLSSWSFSFNTPSFSNSTWAENAGTGLWKVFFHLKATDSSGNVRVLTESTNAVSSVDTSAETLTLTAPVVAALAVNDPVTLDADTAPGGLFTNTTYYVHSKPTSTTIKLSASAGGSVLDIGSIGSVVKLNSGYPWFIIDTDGDKPSISVTQPKNGDQIGGIVSMYGSASDDDGPVMRVEMRIDVNGDSDFADSMDLISDGDAVATLGVDTPIPVTGALLRVGDDAHRWEDESAWYVITTTNDVYNVELNASNELYSSQTGGTGQISIQIRSRDKFGVASEISTRTITLDETFPRIENITPNDTTYQKGTFNLNVDFGDNIDLNLAGNSKIKINLQKAGYTVLTPGAYSAGVHPYTLTAALGAPQHGYTLSYPIDTTTYFNNSSGILYVDLFVQDESTPSPYQNQKSMTFYVDNQKPDIAWSTRIGAPDGYLLNPIKNGMVTVNGTEYAYVEGDYSDSGAVSGVDHVELYFVKGGQVQRLKGAPGAQTALATDPSVAVETFNGTDWTSATSAQPLAKHADAGFGDDYVVKVDKPQEMTSSFTSAVDQDSDGTYEFMGIYGAQRFIAAFDTQYLADGLNDLHYVIYDQIGNITHKVRQVKVANHKPEITKVELGTDLNADTVVDEPAELATSHDVAPAEATYLSGLKARNNFAFLRITATGGNGTKRYSVVHNSVERNATLTNNLIKIDTSGLSDSDWANDKAFVIKVYDSTSSDDSDSTGELMDTITVNLGVYNTDSVAPTIAVADFGKTYPDSNNEANKASTSAVAAYTDNLKMSGPTKLGHVEYAADSKYGNGVTDGDAISDDADVSGQVTFKGKVSDDQRIQWITAAVPGFDPDGAGALAVGAEFDLYASGAVVDGTANGWTFALVNSYLTADHGQVTNWNFTIDTSKIDGGAAPDVVPLFKVYDYKTGIKGTTASASASLSVDVVPYITGLSWQSPFTGRLTNNNMNTGKNGYYPLYQAASGIVVSGFNLLASATQDTNNSIKVGTTALTVQPGGFSTARTSLTIDVPESLTTSGALANAQLTVTTGGVASINNFNDNTKTYNMEGYTVEDDRLIYIDEKTPSISVAPFGKRYPVLATTDEAAVDPLTQIGVTDYTDNVAYTGDKTIKANWLGHVEYADDSVYNPTTADISGQVTFKGKAADNQRISHITAKIPGFDGGTGVNTEFDIYQIDDVDGQMSGTGWSSAVDGTDQKISTTRVDKGHVLNWNFTWNSALVANTASPAVTITFTVYDANDTQLSSASPITVDIVPYISSLTTRINSLLGKDFSRSAQGKYTVWTNTTNNTFETITVNGFNLKPTNVAGGATSDIRLSIDSDALDPTYSVKQGSGLVGTAANGTFTSLTAQMATAAGTPITGEGFLTILTNGVPSLNNVNVDKSYNAETTPLHQNLYDDRRIQPWALTTLRTNGTFTLMANATYPSMAVNGNVPVFAYVNNAFGYGQAHYWNGTTSAETYEAWDLFTHTALDLNANGSRAALYDINIVSQGADLSGDAGGTMINFFYNPQNTAWGSTANFYRAYNLYLDNLNKPGNLAVLGRYGYPDVSVTGNDALTTAYYSVYDAMLDRVIFRTFKVGTNQASVGTNNNMKGGQATNLYTNLVQFNDTGVWPLFTDAAAGNRRFTTTNPTQVAATALNATLVYQIRDPGTTNWVAVGAANNRTGTIFKPTGAGTGTGTAIRLAAAGPVNATTMVAGNLYYVVTTGTTVFTSFGASSNAPGTVFAATGAAIGTGTVSRLSDNNTGASAPGAQVLQTGTGLYTAVDATNTGVPGDTGVAVVAYYNAGLNQLVYRYNATPTDEATWSDEIPIDSNVGGDFVDLAIENTGSTPSNIIHVAYHDSYSGDLKYARISAYDGTISGPYRVDSYLTVGNKLSLALSPTNVPYISYKGMGNTAKVAWLAGALGDGTDTDDKFTGVWESSVVPNKIVDSDTNRFGVGVGTDGRPVIGYTNADATAKGLEYMTKLANLPN